MNRLALPVPGPVLLVVLVAVLAACRYPRDVEGTLDRVQGGTLEVGVVESPPWVVEAPDGHPIGVEVEMVHALARKLDARVRWHWASEEKIAAALKAYQLDLGIGGVVEQPWLTRATSLSRPFFQGRVTVGFREGPIPESLEGIVVTLPAVNDVAGLLRREGVTVRHADDGRPDAPAVAGPAWWLRALGYRPGPWELRRERHVWLLPPGENGWIMAVERHLAGYKDLAPRLREAAASR